MGAGNSVWSSARAGKAVCSFVLDPISSPHFKNLFSLFLSMCMSCVPAWVLTHACWYRPIEAIAIRPWITTELEIQVAVRCLMWVLRECNSDVLWEQHMPLTTNLSFQVSACKIIFTFVYVPV